VWFRWSGNRHNFFTSLFTIKISINKIVGVKRGASYHSGTASAFLPNINAIYSRNSTRIFDLLIPMKTFGLLIALETSHPSKQKRNQIRELDKHLGATGAVAHLEFLFVQTTRVETRRPSLN
jgi:hypothetical protein